MDFWFYLMTPFTWLLEFFYQFFNSYGVALIFFTLIVKIILFPFALKSKKSMIQMNMLSGQLQKLQKQYANNMEKYNEEMQKLYEKENVKPMGGCLWSMLPMFILIPLYAIIRQPMKYLMGMTNVQITAVAEALNWLDTAVANGWVKEGTELSVKLMQNGYNQLYLSSMINEGNVAVAQQAAGETLKAIFPVNFNFLGIDLSQVPTWKFWTNGLSWNSIGLFLLPVLMIVVSALMSYVMSKTNAVNNPAAAKMNWGMIAFSSIMYIFIGFSMPGALSVYLLASSVLGIGQEILCSKMLKKDYEKAAAERKRREQEEKEEEKRLRREKAEQRAKAAEEARKNKGKKVKAEDEDRIPPEVREASRVGIRQYARGRAYDPNRFGGVTVYDEDAINFHLTAPVVAKEDKKSKRKKDETVSDTTAQSQEPAENKQDGDQKA